MIKESNISTRSTLCFRSFTKWVPKAFDKQMCIFIVHQHGRCTKGACTRRTPDGVGVSEGDWATAAVWWELSRWNIEQ